MAEDEFDAKAVLAEFGTRVAYALLYLLAAGVVLVMSCLPYDIGRIRSVWGSGLELLVAALVVLAVTLVAVAVTLVTRATVPPGGTSPAAGGSVAAVAVVFILVLVLGVERLSTPGVLLLAAAIVAALAGLAHVWSALVRRAALAGVRGGHPVE